MHDDLAFSRPMAAAARLGDSAEDHHRFVDKRVLLTGESEVLATVNGRECFLSSLHLLVRICPDVHLAIPSGYSGGQELLNDCRGIAARIAFGGPVTFLDEPADFGVYDAILSVGTRVEYGLPWTVINSDGWLARVSSGPTNLPASGGRPNAIGALAAACLGVGEVFKRLIRLRPSRGRLADGLAFSLFDYATGAVDPGPQLPHELNLDLLIAGTGAIGNGIVYLLRNLPIAGRILIVDAQDFRPENLGTCILIGPSDIGKDKAGFACEFLRPRFDATGFREELAVFSQRLGEDLPFPRMVVSGLDRIDARHDVQRLWPGLVVDGAISDFICQVSRHGWDEDVACLMCLFQDPPGELAEQVASRATGLRSTRVQKALDVVSEEDIQGAPSNKQEWLRARKGSQICSVVQEAMARQISLDQQAEGFAPSVPFVACLSASMVVGELVRSVVGWGSPLQPRFQFDVLRGPRYGMALPQGRRKDCLCTTRRNNIEIVRRRRYERA